MILEVISIQSNRKDTFRSTLYTAYPKLPNEGKEKEKTDEQREKKGMWMFNERGDRLSPKDYYMNAKKATE